MVVLLLIVTIKNESPVEMVLNSTCESSCFLVSKIFNNFGVFTCCNPRLYVCSYLNQSGYYLFSSASKLVGFVEHFLNHFNSNN